jgi:hypothetical protein
LGFVLGVLFLLGLAVVRSLVVDEAKGRLWDLSRALIEGAVRQLPEAYQDEKRAEWHGELDDQRGKPLSALHWSWNLYRYRRSTAHELRADTGPSSLWSPEKAVADPGMEPLHPRLQAAVDLTKKFGWQDILVAMHDPALAEVESPLVDATDRFCRTIRECRLASGLILDRYEPQLDRYFGSGAYRRAPAFHRGVPQVRPASLVGLRSERRLLRSARNRVLVSVLASASLASIALAFVDHHLAFGAILSGLMVVGARTAFGPRRLSVVAPSLFLSAAYFAGLPMLAGLMPEVCFVLSLFIVLFALLSFI